MEHVRSEKVKALIRLLDDDSPDVRNAILNTLVEWGPSLREDLQDQRLVLEAGDFLELQVVLEESDRLWFRGAWSAAIARGKRTPDLEEAVELTSRYIDGRGTYPAVTQLTAQLARDFIGSSLLPTGRNLCQFLFHTKSILGVNPKSYYDPRNSSIRYVIEERRGIPISLVTVLILVGRKTGIWARGCNFPGHFLGIIGVGGRKALVDCYDGGRLLDDDDLAELNDGTPMTVAEALDLECSEEVMVQRMLRNLQNAYHLAEEPESERLVAEILGKTSLHDSR